MKQIGAAFRFVLVKVGTAASGRTDVNIWHAITFRYVPLLKGYRPLTIPSIGPSDLHHLLLNSLSLREHHNIFYRALNQSASLHYHTSFQNQDDFQHFTTGDTRNPNTARQTTWVSQSLAYSSCHVNNSAATSEWPTISIS
jgi:hypothetical protein